MRQERSIFQDVNNRAEIVTYAAGQNITATVYHSFASLVSSRSLGHNN